MGELAEVTERSQEELNAVRTELEDEKSECERLRAECESTRKTGGARIAERCLEEVHEPPHEKIIQSLQDEVDSLREQLRSRDAVAQACSASATDEVKAR